MPTGIAAHTQDDHPVRDGASVIERQRLGRTGTSGGKARCDLGHAPGGLSIKYWRKGMICTCWLHLPQHCCKISDHRLPDCQLLMSGRSGELEGVPYHG